MKVREDPIPAATPAQIATLKFSSVGKRKTGKMSHPVPVPVGPDLPLRKSCIFYKLMVASILQDQRLKIPSKFVKKYGDELASVATFAAPNGRLWLVELKKTNEKYWFDSGWHTFTEHYSISVGHLLLFRYEGNSHFHVHIFDLAASETKYSCSILNSSQQLCNHEQCSIQHFKDVEMGETNKSTGPELLEAQKSACGGNETNIDLGKDALYLQAGVQPTQDIGIQCSKLSEPVSKADEIGSHLLHEGELKLKRIKQETEAVNLGELKEKAELPAVANPGIPFTRRWRVATPEEKINTIRAATLFNPDRPYFKVILRPSYVYKGINLHIPRTFGRHYLKGKTGFITLQLSEGENWTVRVINGNGGLKFSQGWPDFVWANNLNEGDVCVFELISTKDVVLKVTIFRVLEEIGPYKQTKG